MQEKFKRVKPLNEIGAEDRGWTVLNIVRRLVGSRRRGNESELKTQQRLLTSSPAFTTSDAYAFTRELEKLHPDNRHVRDKIRQQISAFAKASSGQANLARCWFIASRGARCLALAVSFETDCNAHHRWRQAVAFR